jgi:trigger factor
VKASTVPLEGHKVKLTVEVGEEELSAVREETVGRLTLEARLPGFRPGHVPRRVLEARLGQKAIREQVLAEALPRYFDEAVEEQQLDVIDQPEIDVTSGKDAGPVVFDATVQVRPRASIPGYEGLVVTLPRPGASDEEVQARLDRLRDQFATLSDVERPARSGDVLTIDVHASRDDEPVADLDLEDYTYELGSGGLVDDADAKLTGSKAGDIVALTAEQGEGSAVELKVLVKRVREKILPAADDAFASDASEFDTIDELRADLADRIATQKSLQANYELRERSLEALAALVDIELPEVLVRREQQHLLASLISRLERQKVRLADYLAMTGRGEDDVLAETEQQAQLQVRADLALRALAEAEALEVDESDLDEEIVQLAQRNGRKPADVRAELERDGRLSGLRSELRNAKALAWLLEHVGIVDDEGNPIDRSALRLDGSGADDAADDDTAPGDAAPAEEASFAGDPHSTTGTVAGTARAAPSATEGGMNGDAGPLAGGGDSTAAAEELKP